MADKLDEVLKEMRKGFKEVNKRLDNIDKRLDNFDKNYLKTHEKDRKRISDLEEAVGL